VNISYKVPASLARSEDDRKFRHDINGLRAIAVIAVVLFHFSIPGAAGGFVGVDVFFAISGYLMTLNIVRRIERGEFSLLDFYGDRFRRIVPALVAMLLAVMLVTVILTDPKTSIEAAKSVATAALFLSNFQFAAESGYFAGPAEKNWLLHTWSLSVEWQFYLLYPIILMLVARVKPLWKHRLLLSVAATCILFVASILICSYSLRALQYGFYLLPTRAWEMLAGGCVFLLPRTNLNATAKTVLAALGVAAIILSVAIIQPSWAWPSWATAFPVLGACAVIATGKHDAQWARVSFVQTIGKWSYSIYLWHWPVIIFMHYYDIRFTASTIMLGIVVSVAIGALSFLIIEPPGSGGNRVLKQKLAGIGVVGCAALGLATIQMQGFSSLKLASLSDGARSSMKDYSEASSDWGGGEACPTGLVKFHGGKLCEFGNAQGPAVLIMGDSHAEQLIARYIGSPSADRYRFTIVYMGGCPFLPDINRLLGGFTCPDFTRHAINEASSGKYAAIAVVSAWHLYLPSKIDADNYDELCSETDGACYPPRSRSEFDTIIAASINNLASSLRAIKSKGSNAFVIGPYPTAGSFSMVADHPPTADDLYKRTYLSNSQQLLPTEHKQTFKEQYADIYRMLVKLADDSGSSFVDASQALCSDECSAYVDGKFAFTDSHHIRRSVVAGDHFFFLDESILPKTTLQ
jgi:peptidoglycan/LPS O-acetylase OafA/YrhL